MYEYVNLRYHFLAVVGDTKLFFFRVGAVIVSSFLLRCILFIILLAVNFISDIYLFVTLMITEVVTIFLIQAEFNKRFYTSIVKGMRTVSRKSTSTSRDGRGQISTSKKTSESGMSTSISL